MWVTWADPTAAQWWCRGLMWVYSAAAMKEGVTFVPIAIVELPVARRRTLAAADEGDGGELRNPLDKN